MKSYAIGWICLMLTPWIPINHVHASGTSKKTMDSNWISNFRIATPQSLNVQSFDRNLKRALREAGFPLEESKIEFYLCDAYRFVALGLQDSQPYENYFANTAMRYIDSVDALAFLVYHEIGEESQKPTRNTKDGELAADEYAATKMIALKKDPRVGKRLLKQLLEKIPPRGPQEKEIILARIEALKKYDNIAVAAPTTPIPQHLKQEIGQSHFHGALPFLLKDKKAKNEQITVVEKFIQETERVTEEDIINLTAHMKDFMGSDDWNEQEARVVESVLNAKNSSLQHILYSQVTTGEPLHRTDLPFAGRLKALGDLADRLALSIRSDQKDAALEKQFENALRAEALISESPGFIDSLRWPSEVRPQLKRCRELIEKVFSNSKPIPAAHGSPLR